MYVPSVNNFLAATWGKAKQSATVADLTAPENHILSRYFCTGK
jgi:hypothetical protein